MDFPAARGSIRWLRDCWLSPFLRRERWCCTTTMPEPRPPIPWPGGVFGSPASNIRTFKEKCLHSLEKYDIILSCQNHTDKIYGRIPEWPKGTDCKSAANCFGGSNPPPSISCRSGGTGRRPGLKIPWVVIPVPVRFRSAALYRPRVYGVFYLTGNFIPY